jgi:predicted dehydrogenase
MKVGIIGLGFRLGYLGYVFKSVDESFEIVGYVDPEPAGLPGLVEKGISVGKAYASPQELIANEKLDLLMIGSPNHSISSISVSASKPGSRCSAKSRSSRRLLRASSSPI